MKKINLFALNLTLMLYKYVLQHFLKFNFQEVSNDHFECDNFIFIVFTRVKLENFIDKIPLKYFQKCNP